MARFDDERTAVDLPHLVPVASISRLARRHAQRMARQGDIFHQSNLGAAVANWDLIREIVGTASSPRTLHRLWMTSPRHRDAIRDGRVWQAGIGFAVDRRGMWYGTAIFRRPKGRLLRRAVAATGVPYGSVVNASEVLRASRRLGLRPGRTADAWDVRRLVRAAG